MLEPHHAGPEEIMEVNRQVVDIGFCESISMTRRISQCFPNLLRFSTWWFIPLSKWVITPVIGGLSLLIPFITRVVTHLRFVG